MRVLILHNRYRAEGGEERAVQETVALLRRHGHAAALLERDSGSVGAPRAGWAMLAGGEDPAAVAEIVRSERIDVVHAHNLHPLLGWRALAAARAAGARTVLHLHNFRLYCAIGVAYRAGAPCHECRERATWPGLVHRCRGGVGEAAVYAAGLALQQPRLLAGADRLVVLSEGHGRLLREHGLDWDRVSVLPNFVADASWASASRAGDGVHALVSGRLVREKGFDVAILAARAAGVPLVIAGTGPDEGRLRELAAGADVRFAGWLSPDELARERAGAGVVLAPSTCEEACPYAVLDALAAGVPVLASERGGLPELVGSDAVVPAGNAGAWSERLAALWADRGARARLGAVSLAEARRRFGEEAYLDGLLAVYGCDP
jgi:glycosyltransferase involved in cell wall biosynthesis